MTTNCKTWRRECIIMALLGLFQPRCSTFSGDQTATCSSPCAKFIYIVVFLVPAWSLYGTGPWFFRIGTITNPMDDGSSMFLLQLLLNFRIHAIIRPGSFNFLQCKCLVKYPNSNIVMIDAQCRQGCPELSWNYLASSQLCGVDFIQKSLWSVAQCGARTCTERPSYGRTSQLRPHFLLSIGCRYVFLVVAMQLFSLAETAGWIRLPCEFFQSHRVKETQGCHENGLQD